MNTNQSKISDQIQNVVDLEEENNYLQNCLDLELSYNITQSITQINFLHYCKNNPNSLDPTSPESIDAEINTIKQELTTKLNQLATKYANLLAEVNVKIKQSTKALYEKELKNAGVSNGNH